jgi:hypothetical protein
MFTDVSPQRLAIYTAEMAKGLAEKLFFLDRLPQGAALLDFGCADGLLLDSVAHLRPDLHLAGLDLSEVVLAKARARGIDAQWFTSNAEGAAWSARLRQQGIPVVLLASSVLHEVHHYGGQRAWESFWDFAGPAHFDGFALRDFSITGKDRTAQDPAFVEAVRAKLPLWQRASFEGIWGTITTRGAAVHAALKAPWADSWEREGPENYFPVDREETAARLHTAYGPARLWDPHRLAFSNADTLRRFGVELPCTTHLKALFGPVWTK